MAYGKNSFSCDPLMQILPKQTQIPTNCHNDTAIAYLTIISNNSIKHFMHFSLRKVVRFVHD